MITEIVSLFIKDNENDFFEESFAEAGQIIAGMNGYLKHELQKCIEVPNKYILLVEWNSIEDHVNGFRTHKKYEEWKNLLHHFYEPFPTVEHYIKIF
ncbi:MAG: antibiotic biosynthesis monooxygenase [Bacteroidota bacterium]|nr:antibiotic biosynthesis monooxygenase [Bacteroidota bacterium]